MTLKLGTRGSPLARWQADWVTARLDELGVGVEQVLIRTEGDVKAGPIGEVGGQGLFTKEIQQALLDGRIDLAVHSLKDLPTEPVDGLALAAVPPRGPVADALVSRDSVGLLDLPPGARIGTGSMRRRAQLLHVRSDLQVLDIRGNVDTRLRKVDEGQYDATLLAEAGLRRLGLADRITEVLPLAFMLPAVGQAALGIETRDDDDATRQALAPLDDPATRTAVDAERSLLSTLRGGCLAPVACLALVGEQGLLEIDARVLSPDGEKEATAFGGGPVSDAAAIVQQLADDLLAQGADELIAQARDFPPKAS